MIELRFVPPELRRLDEAGAEVICCGVFKDARPLTGLAGLLDWRLTGRLSKLAKQGFLVGEVGEVLVLPSRPRLPFDKLLAYGLGPRAAFTDATFEKCLKRVLETLQGLHVKKALLELPGRGEPNLPSVDAERAAEILFDLLGDDERDALAFVEDVETQKRIEHHAETRRRTALRSSQSGGR
jgi:hypothetical protein